MTLLSGLREENVGNNQEKLSKEDCLKCNFCEKSFENEEEYKYHIQVHHREHSTWDNTYEENIKCNYCEKSFEFEDELEYHMNVHHREHTTW